MGQVCSNQANDGFSEKREKRKFINHYQTPREQNKKVVSSGGDSRQEKECSFILIYCFCSLSKLTSPLFSSLVCEAVCFGEPSWEQLTPTINRNTGTREEYKIKHSQPPRSALVVRTGAGIRSD